LLEARLAADCAWYPSRVADQDDDHADDHASAFVDDDAGEAAARARGEDDAGPADASEDEIPKSRFAADTSDWQILIVDDEQEVHEVTTLALRGARFQGRGLSFRHARSSTEAREQLATHPDLALVLLDVVMETDDAGLQIVRHIRESMRNELVRIVLRTGQPGQAPETTIITTFDISDYRTKTELTSTRLFTTVVGALRAHAQLSAAEAQRRELARLYAEQKAAYRTIADLKRSLEQERDELRDEVKDSVGSRRMIGDSPVFAQAVQQLDAVARTDATVLLLGESGCGKEVLARSIHARSSRAAGPLVKVNCASIPRELFESEFFGHVRGSFTGAHRDRIGRFQLADKGTLFLDEVGEIPLELQSKLLRTLQERELERVGDTRTYRVDVRVVAATNRDLKAEVAAGRFRADLYYRLGVFPLQVPPLRKRREDIVPLFEHFLARACRDFRRPRLVLTPCDVAALESYDWPGNVRELQNVVERAVILATDGVLRLDLALDLAAEGPEPRDTDDPAAEDRRTPLPFVRSTPVPFERAAAEPLPRPPSPPGTATQASAKEPAPDPEFRFYTANELRELERRNIIAALERTNWKVAGDGGAAALLGVKPSTLTYQIRSFGIERES
jgi:transcriptional regulator with GAF, ATPase, and Fis domain